MKSHFLTYLRYCICVISAGILLSQTVISAQETRDTVITNFHLWEDIPQEKVYLHLDKPYYGAGEKIWFKEYLVNAVTHKDNCLSNFIITELLSSSDSLVCRKKIRRDSLGLFHNAIELPADLPQGNYYLRAYTNLMQNTEPDFHYSRNLTIGNSLIDTDIPSEPKVKDKVEKDKQKKRQKSEEDRNDFTLTFFPEGGALLAVTTQCVAFKAIGSDGFSKEIEGALIDSKGDTLKTFRSEHKGMGTITLFDIKPDNPIHAIATSSDGVTKRFEFPAVENTGFALHVTQRRNSLNYEVLKTQTTEWPEKLFLIGHTRGSIALMHEISPDKAFGRLSCSNFMTGISHFMLADNRGNILSERLVFIPEQQKPQWQITPDKAKYGEREKVTLNINITDTEGMPVKGNFSVSITDSRKVHPDSLADNILSNLLLTSDLKGHVEDPGYYFINQDAVTIRNLDILMLTHGWRRYRMDNVLNPQIPKFPHYIEKGQVISGHVKGFFGKNVKKGQIVMLSPKKNIFATTDTNDNGEFSFDTSFPDSTTFAIQARTSKGFASVDIIMDKEQFQSPFHKSPFLDSGNGHMDAYLMNAREQYFLEGGESVIRLKEAVVTAEKRKASAESIYTGGINTYSIEEDKLSIHSGRTVIDIAYMLPGVAVRGDTVYVRNSRALPLAVIDDVVYDEDIYSILSTLHVDDITSISLVRGADASIFGVRGEGGAIVITLKTGVTLNAQAARGIVTYAPLGYSNSVEFYHPEYETPQEKNPSRADLRSTIYWAPSLQFDEKGNAVIEYYTPDSTAPEDITIEGIDEYGRIYRLTQRINTTEKL